MNGSGSGSWNSNIKTYAAYNQDGQCLGTARAGDANDYINPNQVKAAIRAIVDEANDQIKKNIMKSIDSAYRTGAVIINDTDLLEPSNDMDSTIRSIPGYIEEAITPFGDMAVDARDKKQIELNNYAYNALLSEVHKHGVEGVTIREI